MFTISVPAEIISVPAKICLYDPDSFEELFSYNDLFVTKLLLKPLFFFIIYFFFYLNLQPL